MVFGPRYIFERNSATLYINVKDFDFHYLTDFNGIERVRNKLVGNLRDVNKSVLMDTDINKRTEIYNISYCADKLHSGL